MGVYVLMAGVRLLLGEIVPAFRGISMKLVPNAKPALDCPVLFPYSPNAVIVGFITTTIGSVILIAMFTLPLIGFAVIVPVLTNFFAGGTAGIFGNVVGGRRGAIIGGSRARSLHHVATSAAGDHVHSAWVSTACPQLDSDTIAWPLFFAYVVGPIMKRSRSKQWDSSERKSLLSRRSPPIRRRRRVRRVGPTTTAPRPAYQRPAKKKKKKKKSVPTPVAG